MSQALIKYERPGALECRKRSELAKAIAAGQVNDPISILIAAGVAAAVSAASYSISYALQPKPPTQHVGQLSGNIQLQNSEQGIFIPEIYGAGPEASVVSGSAANWQSAHNVSISRSAIIKNAGTDLVFNASASHNTSVAADEEAFIRFTPDIGSSRSAVEVGFALSVDPRPSSPNSINIPPTPIFSTTPANFEFAVRITSVFLSSSTPTKAFGVIMNGVDNGIDIGTASDTDEFWVEKRKTGGVFKYHLYKNAAEVTGFTAPEPSNATSYIDVAIWATTYGLSAASVQIGAIGDPPNAGAGGCKVPAIIVWCPGLRKHETPVQQQQHGGKGHAPTETVIQTTYDMDIDLMWGRGQLDLLRIYANADIIVNNDPRLILQTGAFNPDTGGDVDQNPTNPPDPNLSYSLALHRFNAEYLPLDPDDPGGTIGGIGGQIQSGNAGMNFYPGSTAQQPDSTEEADVDAKNGANSTSAYRGRARSVLSAFYLTRWNGLVPNFNGVLQNQTLKTLGAIFASLCDREGLTSIDYDFSGVDDVIVRGLKMDGSRYAPASVMDTTELQSAYNYFTTEGEGKIRAFVNGDEPSITIPYSDFGWVDAGTEPKDLIQTIVVEQDRENSLPKEVDVKYVDPNNDWDPNMQPSQRKIVAGTETETLQVTATLLPDEARAGGQRRLYMRYVAGQSYKFTLPWTYAFIYPGYRITTTTDDGFTYVFRLNSQNGGIGLIDCDATALEVESYNQSAVGSQPIDYNPGQLIPAMTLAALIDIPIFRAAELGLGFYLAGCPRTLSTMTYRGFSLWRSRAGGWEKLAMIQGTAIIGRVVSSTFLYPSTSVISLTFSANSGTDALTITGHLLVSDASVRVSNSGGVLPSPLVAGTTYFVRDITTNTFKLAATLGGSAINLTTNGTGTNSLTVGEIVVDLYGTTAALASVSQSDMTAGSNRASAGELVFGFADAEQDAAYQNRWTLRTLLVGQDNTYGQIGDTLVGRAFVLLDENVHFVQLEEGDINSELTLRAVTLGQSLDDASEFTFTCTGASVKGPLVANLDCIYDTIDNDGLYIWTGSRDSTAPLSESYDFELLSLDGATTLLGPTVITPTLNQNLSEFVSYQKTAFSSLSDLLTNGGVQFLLLNFTNFPVIESIARLDMTEGGSVRMQVGELPIPQTFGIVKADGTGHVWSWRRQFTSGTIATVYAEDTAVTFEITQGDWLEIFVRPDMVVEFYRNRMGPATKPFWVSTFVADRTAEYKVIASEEFDDFSEVGIISGFTNSSWVRNGAEIKITGAKLIDLYSGVTSTRFRVRQHSLLNGGLVGDWVDSGVISR